VYSSLSSTFIAFQCGRYGRSNDAKISGLGGDRALLGSLFYTQNPIPPLPAELALGQLECLFMKWMITLRLVEVK
jgi:hypothetical protein